MKLFKVLSIFLTIIAADFAWSLDYPIPASDEIIVLVLDESQARSLCSKENYGSLSSPEGVCYGWDQVNFSLLMNIQFSLKKTDDSFLEIQKKLISAYEGAPQIIYGFTSSEHFMRTMENRWDEADNPLKNAIEIVHLDQNPQELPREIIKRKIFIKNDGAKKTLRTDSIFIEQNINNGIPVHIYLLSEEGAHAVTIVGYRKKKNSQEAYPHEFLVLDSEAPHQLQSLLLIEDEIESSWLYVLWVEEVFMIWSLPSIEEEDVSQKVFKAHYLEGFQKKTTKNDEIF